MYALNKANTPYIDIHVKYFYLCIIVIINDFSFAAQT